MAEAIFTRCVNPPNVMPIEKGGTGGTNVTQARTNLSVMTIDKLYDNERGTAGTIELSDTIAHYQVVEVFYMLYTLSADWNQSSRIYNEGSNDVCSSLINVIGGSSGGNPRLKIYGCNFYILDNTLGRLASTMGNITDTNTTIAQLTSTDIPKIYKVIGYRY